MPSRTPSGTVPILRSVGATGRSFFSRHRTTSIASACRRGKLSKSNRKWRVHPVGKHRRQPLRSPGALEQTGHDGCELVAANGLQADRSDVHDTVVKWLGTAAEGPVPVTEHDRP